MGPGTTRSTASAAIEAVLGAVQALTESGGRLHIARFGTFELKQVPERKGYDIGRGCMVARPASERLAFTPAKGFPRRS